jgi:hypothetical protein
VARFCANCGTEVDETAVFCPTCGQPIDQEVESAMPPAPSWPDPEPAAPREPAEPDPESESEAAFVEPMSRADHAVDDDREDPEATRVEARPAPPVIPPETEGGSSPLVPSGPAPGPRGAPPKAADRSAKPTMDLPITTPVTLSGWLIGGGAALAALGALFALFDGLGTAIDVLILVAMLGVAASVFLSDRLPNLPHLRLATLAVVLVAFGVALDRLGFGRAGAGELLLFLGTAAAAIGAILLETGQDQPLGGPSA